MAKWLDSWKPKEKKLIIFGSSAGYSLAENFLQRFHEVQCVEPDFFARWLLQKRFPQIKFTFSRQYELLSQLEDKDWANFLLKNQETAFLFCNILGQLPFLQKSSHQKFNDQIETKLTHLFKQLEGRSWASYHDVVSTTNRIRSFAPATFFLNEASKENSFQKLLQQNFLDSEITITDHRTWSASCQTVTKNLLLTWWRMTPYRHHLIAFVSKESPAELGAHPLPDKESRSLEPSL